MRRTIMGRAAAVAVAAALAAAPAAAGIGGLPDLVPTIDTSGVPPLVQRHQTVPPADLAEGCAGGPTDRTLLRFTLITDNIGTADLVLGDPGCPDCSIAPGPTCTNPLYECSPADGHGHGHFSKYALFEILPARDGEVVATGRKQGFCLEDTLCDVRTYTCENQGLAVGCQDAYFWFLGCQYVDVTDLPGGRYVLRATVNFEAILPESDYTNNATETVVEVCEGTPGPRVRLKRKAGAPEVLRWRARGKTLVRPPLLPPDPRRDGARLRLEADGGAFVDLVIPGDGAGRCGPKDGWRRRRGTATYTNRSGFLDADCSVPAGGLRSLAITVKPKRDPAAPWVLRYRAKGATPLPDDPGRLRATVVAGADTGGCWTGAATCDGRRCTPDSAAGAFVD